MVLKGHNNGIDTLRGLSILSVILLHLNIRVPFSQTYFGSLIPLPVYKILFWSGYYGVCVFFVVSGFLITTTTMKRWNSLPDISAGGFYFMRFARIMPLLFFLIIILSLLHLAGLEGFVINPQHTSLGHAVFAALTFHINLLEIKTGFLPGSWDILWSLSIEEFFYLFFPLVCLLIRKEKYFVFVTLACLILSPFARTIFYTGYSFPDTDHNHFAYLDALSLGCLAAIIARRVKLTGLMQTILGAAGWGLIILVFCFRGLVREMGLAKTGLNVTVLVTGAAMVLIWMQRRCESGQQVAGKLTACFRFLGKNSYEIYLTHMFVVYILVEAYKYLNMNGEWTWMLYLSALVLSGILGNVVASYFSNPINVRLRQWFEQWRLNRAA
jgi:peptidoglycan/LPS O-acetylase OafA/YrhL